MRAPTTKAQRPPPCKVGALRRPASVKGVGLHGSSERVDRLLGFVGGLGCTRGCTIRREVIAVKRRAGTPVPRTSLTTAVHLFTVLGMLRIVAGICLWGFGSHAERGIAILVGGGGFVELCFCNAVSGLSRTASRGQRPNG
jgi:hypothetical protein